MNRADFQTFWQGAVSALLYEIRSASEYPIRQARINEIWRRELLEQRFETGGLMHGATVWLQELEAEDPELAGRVRAKLESSRIEAGVKDSQLAGGALGAAAAIGGAAVAIASGKQSGKLGGALAGAAGAVAAGANGRAILGALSLDGVCDAIRADANRQLREFESMLGI